MGTTHHDLRGEVHQRWAQAACHAATGHEFAVAQVNCTVSRRGALRGISVLTPPSYQAKYVTCVAGAVLDVIVDLRVGSPSFGRWHMQRLEASTPTAMYLCAGLGHATLALAEDSTVLYLLSSAHDPDRSHRVDPFDPDIGITWPSDIELIASSADSTALGLRDAREAGLLPRYDDRRSL